MSSTGRPWVLLVYRICMFLITFAVQYIQIAYRSLRALRYFTVWNWIAIIVYFFLGSISSIQHQLVPTARQEKKKTSNIDRLLVSLFHAILPMTLFIDVVTWTILTPMLVNVPDPERALHWRTVMYSPISYMQHGGNAIIMFGEFLLNTIPNSDSWSHGVVALWSILFGIWSLIFFSFTGQAIYPFLDTSKKTGHPVWVAYLGLSLMGLGSSYLVQRIIRFKHQYLNRRISHKID